jgi:hypothetical protein
MGTHKNEFSAFSMIVVRVIGGGVECASGIGARH